MSTKFSPVVCWGDGIQAQSWRPSYAQIPASESLCSHSVVSFCHSRLYRQAFPSRWLVSYPSLCTLKKHLQYQQTTGLIHRVAYFSKNKKISWHLVHFSVPRSNPFLIDSSLISSHTLPLPPVSDVVSIQPHSLGDP